mgnify:FL=1
MVDRFSSCQYGNNSKQIKKKKTEKSTMLNISNKEQMNTWTRLNECQHLQNSKFSNLWDFDKVEDDINSFIAILQREQWRDCNNSILFSIFKKIILGNYFLPSLDGGGILDLFCLYCKIWMSTKYYLLDSIHVPKILLSN